MARVELAIPTFRKIEICSIGQHSHFFKRNIINSTIGTSSQLTSHPKENKQLEILHFPQIPLSLHTFTKYPSRFILSPNTPLTSHFPQIPLPFHTFPRYPSHFILLLNTHSHFTLFPNTPHTHTLTDFKLHVHTHIH